MIYIILFNSAEVDLKNLYRWQCLVCDTANSSGVESCFNCGCSSTPTGEEVSGRKTYWSRAGGNADELTCPSCGDKFLFAKTFEYVDGIPVQLFTQTYLQRKCLSCDFYNEEEYKLTFMRKLLRKYFSRKPN